MTDLPVESTETYITLTHDTLEVALTPLRNRLRREATVGLQLDHPNVVRTLDVGEARGLSYIALEVVEGGDARKLLRREMRAELMRSR